MNGDNYSEEWPIEAGKRGVWRIDSGVEAMKRISEPKNVALFEGLKVMSKRECDARAECMHDHYSGYVEIEANAMLDMFQQHVIPSVKVRRRTARSAQGAAACMPCGVHCTASPHCAPSTRPLAC
jgi:glutamine synthetase type III